MQGANPIHRKGHGWGYAHGKARRLRSWFAACPACGKEINGGYTRKAAKDALYRHVQKEHEPGLVGR